MIENSIRGEEIGVAASEVFQPASDAGINCSLHRATSICYGTLGGFHSRSSKGSIADRFLVLASFRLVHYPFLKKTHLFASHPLHWW